MVQSCRAHKDTTIEHDTGTVRLANAFLELTVSTRFGPRVVGFSFANEPNALAELGDLSIDLADGRSYALRGGHRLWVAPEVPEITYEPDDGPVAVELASHQVTVTQPASEKVPIQKAIVVILRDGLVTLIHTLSNVGDSPLDIAPWAITQLPVGGTAIIPLNSAIADPHQLLPNASIVLWPYAGLTDSPFVIDNRLLLVDAKRTTATKVGTPLTRGWLAYLKNGLVFVKRAAHVAGERYVDLNASGQCYSGPEFVELETLGPRARLTPGASTSHTETWELHRVGRDIAPHQIPQLLDLDGGTGP